MTEKYNITAQNPPLGFNLLKFNTILVVEMFEILFEPKSSDSFY